MLLCEIFAVVTLAITLAWVYTARNYTLKTLAWAMFFPGLFAPWFNDDPHFILQVLGFGQLSSSLLYTALSVIWILVTLLFIYVVNYITGWGKPVHSWWNADKRLISNISPSLEGFLRCVGEEVGWRCYLLPCLLTYYSTVNALFYSGIIWALYHLPVMVLLSHKFRVHHRWKTVILQGIQCVIASFSFGYIAMCSGFSIWAPAIMHAVWNILNPALYGSVYTQERGDVLYGEQWLINGEGLAGCIAWTIPAIYVYYTVN